MGGFGARFSGSSGIPLPVLYPDVINKKNNKQLIEIVFFFVFSRNVQNDISCFASHELQRCSEMCHGGRIRRWRWEEWLRDQKTRGRGVKYQWAAPILIHPLIQNQEGLIFGDYCMYTTRPLSRQE